ncbi:hypothetical protein [Actinomadura sp. WMMB 499]|uniref:hypothetical protein n=1 Tax=Actinomadura sp. WMMB 499 TaxID=1219491 RepID=UPI001247B324|nr:hypothetical protein [Actinomadura sp. WMMB 499]QFG23380.1 hypothetical protein F7P10_21950 [Actinomadura sp. WMMB 499]
MADSGSVLAAMPFQPPWDVWDVVGVAGVTWAIVTLVAAAAGDRGCGTSVAAGALMALAVALCMIVTRSAW